MNPANTILIEVHRDAPTKPVPGAACNGCGVCCLVAPCPLARVWLWQWRGACRALIWDAPASRYRCGLVQNPRQYLRWLPAWLMRWLQPAFARWIAAGSGCDADYEVRE